MLLYLKSKANSSKLEIFFKTIILNRGAEVSDQDLSALGKGIKELRSLTNLSLNFRYFN
jgi:hypothetical protein